MSQLPHTGSSTFGIFNMWDFSFLAVACNLLVSACVHSSLTRDRTQAPCIGRAEYQPLDHQGSHARHSYYPCSKLQQWRLREVKQLTSGLKARSDERGWRMRRSGSRSHFSGKTVLCLRPTSLGVAIECGALRNMT